ncbi:MAG: hypothetical protein AAGA91_10630 [Pseudomonadota bacterium]
MQKVLNVLFLAVAIPAHSADEAAYRAFFERYAALNEAYDPALADLYANEAVILAARKTSVGSEQIMRLEGRRWKELVAANLEQARQRGDRSEFSDIEVTLQGRQATITASRYAVLSCFTDDRYYMIVKTVETGSIEIVEEFVETPSRSQCVIPEQEKVASVLQGTAKVLSGRLPMMVDEGTRLEAAKAQGNTLTLQYELINHTSEQLDGASLERSLRPLVIKQTCDNPDLRAVLDQGAVVTYRYYGSDRAEILEMSLNAEACLSPQY